MKICREEKCTGCGVCVDACPKGCIQYLQDKNGFYKPLIDEAKCVKCKRCISVCPSYNPNNNTAVLKAYKARRISEAAARKSSSGGLAAVFAEYVIKNGGVAVGCAFYEDMRLEHKIAATASEAESFKGSKYLQSDTVGIYKNVKQRLQRGEDVLFIGTPCQVSALNNYISKEYANLITVDFVCHGVQSHKVFNKFLSSLGEADSPLLVEFRNKDHGYDDTKGRNEWNVVFPHKNIKASTDKGAFLWFASSLSLRASCYGCSFSAQKRCSDITVADYTGKDLTEEDKRIGVSTVLVNTKKGEALLENCKAEIVTEEKVLDCVLRSYKRLNGKTRAPRCRKAFFKDLQELDYTALTEKYTLKKILPSKIVRRLDGLKKRLGF